MSEIRGTSPEEYAGAFQHFEEIPYRYRLETYESQYQGQNTWEEYAKNVVLTEHDTDVMQQRLRLAGDSWHDHMDARGRHQAVATIEDIESWCKDLIADRARRTVYGYYFLRVYNFYDHLKYSTDHPHLYNPVLLAATRYPASRKIWMYRVDKRSQTK